MSGTPPLAAHKSSIRRPVPGYRLAILVAEACEELWSVQDAQQAQSWLQLLHSALLRESVDAYDPSDAFLAIQAAAFNFPATWEHALWAAAALVRVCVGPAWRCQRVEPRAAFGSTSTTLSDSTGESSPGQHHSSPRSFSPLSAVDATQMQHPYPYIPEVLSGALLRFAAQSPMVSRHAAEAQRELVLGLCCLDDGTSFEQRSLLEWNIPGAHEPVEKMLRFWFESATSTFLPQEDLHEQEKQEGVTLQPISQKYPIELNDSESVTSLTRRLSHRTMDWWYTLHVARACSDLISVGWRPNEHHAFIVIHLLDIVEQGMFLKHMSPTATDQQSREMRLAAISSAAESVSALASLGSRELLPHALLPVIVDHLLKLQAAATMSTNNLHLLYPLGTPQSSDQENEMEQERETFFTQRASCFTDTADFLWILLAHTTSAVSVIKTLLNRMDDDLQQAAVVVRIVSGALWGKPPNVPGIATLRIFWMEFIEALHRLGFAFIQVVNGQEGHNQSRKLTKSSMTLTLEVVVALGRLVEIELLQGRGIIAADEWEVLIKMLRDVIIPLLQLKEARVTEVYIPSPGESRRAASYFSKRLAIEADAVLLKIADYLEKCSRFQTHRFHLIVDDAMRDALHTLLLREAVPLMTKGPYLAIRVLQSWAAIGFYSDRRETWIDTASHFVAEVFAVYKDPALSKYGGFVHAPDVRLEALFLLSDEGVDSHPFMPLSETQTICPTVATSGSFSFRPSPLTAMKCIDDDYRAFFKESILPCLSLVFNTAICDGKNGQVLLFSKPASPETVPVDEDLWKYLAENATSERDYNIEHFKLRKYAIDLMGRLFCSSCGTKECRSHFVEILKDVAIMPSMLLPSNSPLTDEGAPKERKAERERAANIVTNRSLLALESIGQLETCLCAPFFSVPFSHENIPSIIEALCAILNHSSRQIKSEYPTLNMQQKYSYRLLLYAALLPLSRLRRAYNGGLMLIEREEAMDHFPEGIVNLFDERHCDIVDDEGPFVAPFAYVDMNCRARNSSTSTLISFEPIVKELIDLLGGPVHETVKAEAVQQYERAVELNNRFRSSCYDTILNHALSGVVFDDKAVFDVLVSLTPSKGAYSRTENFARLRALLALFQRGALKSLNTVCIPESMATLVEQVLRLCKSVLLEDVISGCKLLIGVFPTLASSKSEMCTIALMQLHQDILATLISTMRQILNQVKTGEVLGAKTDEEQPQIGGRSSSLMFLLYETSLYHLESFGCLESTDAKHLISLCYEVASSPHLSRACRTLAVRCAVAVINRLKEEDVQDTVEKYVHLSRESNLGADSMSSQLDFPESDIILNAISKRLIFETNSVPTETGESEHYILAREVDDMKCFDRSKHCVAAWLCGEHLITFKVGGSRSRTCGWVEIVIRGATFRRRELVRLSNSVSVDNPELASCLWVEASTSSEDRSYAGIKAPEVQDDNSVLERAMKLLERADHVLENYPITHDVSDQDSVEQSHRSSSVWSEGPSPPSSPRYAHSVDSQVGIHSQKSQEDITHQKIPSHIETSDPASIRAWLNEVFDDALHVKDILDRLSALQLDSIIDGGGFQGQTNIKRKGEIALHPVQRLALDDRASRAIHLLDRTVTLNTHKIALMYAGPPNARSKDEEDEVDFLLNAPAASPAFFAFANGLGGLVSTKHLKYFSAGLDTSGADMDGQHALVWIEHNKVATPSNFLTVYHAVPYMPQNVNNRKRHVGNDAVHIVFCDPGSLLHEEMWAGGAVEEMENVLVSGEFGFVTLFIVPLSEQATRVKLQVRPGLPEGTMAQLQHLPGEDIIPCEEAPKFVRRLANLADIACSSILNETLGPPTSWETRLRQLRLMRRHAL